MSLVWIFFILEKGADGAGARTQRGHLHGRRRGAKHVEGIPPAFVPGRVLCISPSSVPVVAAIRASLLLCCRGESTTTSLGA
jgi:hypothetical protein